MAATGKLIRCSWGFRRGSIQVFAPPSPSLATCTETVSETYHIPVLALPCWVTVVTSGKMLPPLLSYLLRLWSCDVLVWSAFELFSQCDRKQWVIFRHNVVSSTASQLVWLQTLALIYQAGVQCDPFSCKNQKCISHCELRGETIFTSDIHIN